MHQGLADFYGGKSLSLYLDTKQSTGAGGDTCQVFRMLLSRALGPDGDKL